MTEINGWSARPPASLGNNIPKAWTGQQRPFFERRVQELAESSLGVLQLPGTHNLTPEGIMSF
jgi:hypothetical protein